MGDYLPWTAGRVASGLAGRALWLWLGVLDAVQGVGESRSYSISFPVSPDSHASRASITVHVAKITFQLSKASE